MVNPLARRYFSGLADFKASMSGKFDNGTAKQGPTKIGSLRYEVSQLTRIKGNDDKGGFTSATQTVTSRLVADIARSRNGLTVNTDSGNYDSYHIDDTATTTTQFTTSLNKVLSATSQQVVHQLQHYERVQNRHAVESKDTPFTLDFTRNLLEKN